MPFSIRNVLLKILKQLRSRKSQPDASRTIKTILFLFQNLNTSKLNFFATAGKPADWNHPFAPQKNANNHKRIVPEGNPKNEVWPGVITNALAKKQILAIALKIKAVGKNFLTSELSAKTPLTNFPIPYVR